MRKLINDPESFVDEVLEGLVLAHAGRIRQLDDEPRAVVRVDGAFEGRVTIATGGGSGHLPAFVGYVGRGLADGAAVGNLFASPSADQMLAVTRAIDGGQGVLYLYGNYGGDRLNFELAADIASAEGIRVETVLAADDVASAPPERGDQRRGIAGIFFGYKVAGACAASGADLDTVATTARHALSRTRSLGVALSSCILPTVGHPNFEVPEGEMEIGMGIHGEPGVRRGPLLPADEVVDDLVDRLLDDLSPDAGSEFAVLVNGLGATPPEELHLAYRRTHQRLVGAGHTIRRVYVGEFATSLEMAGASISLLHLDDTLIAHLEAAADPPLTMSA
ncbi:MAG TPA: dihydroxyacetone kinase subunit DhaK [Solirubrobacteraceae bacterium]|nr:dihydroxyacetone kinase subunit DhaK [Solirubrobacteraceae bacterium]